MKNTACKQQVYLDKTRIICLVMDRYASMELCLPMHQNLKTNISAKVNAPSILSPASWLASPTCMQHVEWLATLTMVIGSKHPSVIYQSKKNFD